MNEELASLYREQLEIRKRLSQVDIQIGIIQKNLDEETIVKTMSVVLDDDREFVKWFTKRKDVLENRKRKENIKNKISKGIKLSSQDALPDDTYIYALYDEEDIVYIGITKELNQRIKQHKRTKKVFSSSHKILNIFDDRFYALREENNLIKVHKPKYNKQSF